MTEIIISAPFFFSPLLGLTYMKQMFAFQINFAAFSIIFPHYILQNLPFCIVRNVTETQESSKSNEVQPLDGTALLQEAEWLSKHQVRPKNERNGE